MKVPTHPYAPIRKCMRCGKLKNVGKATCGRPTLLTITKCDRSLWRIAHEWHLGSNMTSTKHVDDLGMNSYACWITFGGVKLIHIHWNWWACELVETTSTYTSLLIQALIYYHPPKTIDLESPNGGAFSNKYAHGCICDYCKCCTTEINSQNKPDLG